MSVSKVVCQGCGADLEVEDGLRFVSCRYCGSKLEIVHDDTVVYSKVIEELKERTEAMAGDLRVIRLQNELEQLERGWESRRDSLMRVSRAGAKVVPSRSGSFIGGVVAILFGVMWMVFASQIGAPGIFPLFGLVFIGVAVATMLANGRKAAAYEREEGRIDARRRELLAELERAKGESR